MAVATRLVTWSRKVCSVTRDILDALCAAVRWGRPPAYLGVRRRQRRHPLPQQALPEGQTRQRRQRQRAVPVARLRQQLAAVLHVAAHLEWR